MLLRPTVEARKQLDLEVDKTTRESIAHEFWKRFYAEKFKKKGYEVQLEAPRKVGRVDVLATKGAERVGIEVETGTSDVVKNVKQNLASGFDRILVVATTEKALKIVERSLARAGLLLPERVTIILQDRQTEKKAS